MKERDLIKSIASMVGSASGDLLQGIGDDCAVIQKSTESVWLLTMDTLVETVHFDCRWHGPEKIGRKAVAVNVSDIAAMGGTPVFVLLSLGLPSGFDESWFFAFSKGLISACRDYGCQLIGGDTVCSPDRISISLTVIGEADRRQVLYRHGGKAGDTIWISGPLGLAAAGLELYRHGIGLDRPELQPLFAAHLNPPARVVQGKLLAASGLVHAMMDLSDGLATDLAHLCNQSGTGARINQQQLFIDPAVATAARLLHKDPFELMFGGGEDYELLFTSPASFEVALTELMEKNGHAILRVGRLTHGSSVQLKRPVAGQENFETVTMDFQGFDHFQTQEKD